MHIVIISYNKFPNGDAGSIREYSIAKLLQSLHHQVTIIGMGNEGYRKKNEYKGIDYYSLRNTKKSFINKLRNYFCYSRRLKFVINNIEKGIEVFLVVDIPINALLMIKRIAIKQNIRLLHNSVEWYSPEQFKFKQLSPSYILKNLYNKVLIDKNFRVIAQSKYLEQYFKNRKIEVERIPIIFPIDDIPYNKKVSFKKLNLLYAGSPGKKDYLSEMLKGLALLPHNALSKIEFNIFGVTESDIKKTIDIKTYNIIINSIRINGKVPRDIVLENLKSAHFTVLLRNPHFRYSKAGFPSKVVESLFSGTPVITNLSSDLNDYLIDGLNSIIVKDFSAEAFMESVNIALSLSEDKMIEMFLYSNKTAVSCFEISKYQIQINNLILK